MAVELMLEPVLNCQSVWPVVSSSAMNSPVNLPVNTRPPPVASIPAALGKSVNGISHLFSPVSGLMARKCPTTSPGLISGSPGVDAGRARAHDDGPRPRELLYTRYVPRAR